MFVLNRPKLENLPVVLLTARSGVEAQVEALEAKADDFVGKPFNRRALRARLVNLSRRETEWKKAAEEHKDELLPETAQFLDEVKKLVLEDIDSTESSVSQLSEQLNMSERTFQRKVKEAASVPAATFIRTVKLERAKELLEEGLVRSVTQAAMETGFGNVSYFSKVFEETYGINPKSYML